MYSLKYIKIDYTTRCTSNNIFYSIKNLIAIKNGNCVIDIYDIKSHRFQ